ncbi:alkylmercury lyase family protein [Phenylobacterium sp. J367]|uniref:alkylmercury lyase family protein n=1 Tax=Phenylobacterium sp. J367 TaxID=2898435 RepID=UPI0021509124|nr:alkylmercury lyase family protein [Phenylobacterium sp. J367]MCR5877600.1 alkylmercury lyase family protein [Phenylobacterium sp. J367]
MTIPDWGAVTTPQAQDALTAIVEAFIGPKWDKLDEIEGRIHCIVLSGYAAGGRAPATADVAAAAGLTLDGAASVLRRLSGRDLLILDAGGRISGAYPFTDGPTEHHVEANGLTLGAMCAIDALGIGAMLERDVVIHSACRHCARPLTIRTRCYGREVDQVEPSGIVVWSGHRYAAGCAASSLCTVQAFFCDDAHLEAWRANSPAASREGVRLSLAEALEVGVAIFAPMRMELSPWIPTI